MNGFWFLEVSTQKPSALWRSITARSRWGLIVHTYRLDGMLEEQDPCPT